MTNCNVYVNPIYKKRIWDCNDPRVFLFGGAGSGKSNFAIAWTTIRYFLSKPRTKPERVLYVRKIARTIKNSLWEPTKVLLQSLGVWRKMKVNETEKTILNPATNNAIIMTGLDDVEKIKSIYGITKMLYEEISEGEEEDLLQLELRMRGMDYDGFFQFIGLFNPVSDRHFLVKHVEPFHLPSHQQPQNVVDFEYINQQKSVWRFANVDTQGNKTYTTVANTNYKHNTKLDDAYINKLRLLASVDEVYSQVYEHGRWGAIVDGNRYAYNFKEHIHVKPTPYLRGDPIHYSNDFNVEPHMTGICAQIRYDAISAMYEVRIFKELALKHPHNEAFWLGAEFVAYFEDVLTSGVFLYGDASGNNRTGTENAATLFKSVKSGFGKWANILDGNTRIPTHNPRYDKIAAGAMGRKTFLNALLQGVLPCRISIDPSCVELIADLRLCYQDANGKLAKPKNKHGHEERGHALQALEYLLCHPLSVGELAIL